MSRDLHSWQVPEVMKHIATVANKHFIVLYCVPRAVKKAPVITGDHGRVGRNETTQRAPHWADRGPARPVFLVGADLNGPLASPLKIQEYFDLELILQIKRSGFGR